VLLITLVVSLYDCRCDVGVVHVEEYDWKGMESFDESGLFMLSEGNFLMLCIKLVKFVFELLIEFVDERKLISLINFDLLSRLILLECNNKSFNEIDLLIFNPVECGLFFRISVSLLTKLSFW